MLFRTVGVFSVGSGIKRECEKEMERKRKKINGLGGWNLFLSYDLYCALHFLDEGPERCDTEKIVCID